MCVWIERERSKSSNHIRNGVGPTSYAIIWLSNYQWFTDFLLTIWIPKQQAKFRLSGFPRCALLIPRSLFSLNHSVRWFCGLIQRLQPGRGVTNGTGHLWASGRVCLEAGHHPTILFIIAINCRIVNVDNKLLGTLAVGTLASSFLIRAITNLGSNVSGLHNVEKNLIKQKSKKRE